MFTIAARINSCEARLNSSNWNLGAVEYGTFLNRFALRFQDPLKIVKYQVANHLTGFSSVSAFYFSAFIQRFSACQTCLRAKPDVIRPKELIGVKSFFITWTPFISLQLNLWN